MLVAIDEVERLQDEIERGRANTDFLDLVRAIGDRLDRVRVLLVSAHPLVRLGRDWVDRLISVVQRDLGYLEPDAARSLMCQPIDGFPDIYPPGGVDRIAHETRGHPYLIQLVCDKLTRHLNDQKRLQATDADIELAIDTSFEDAEAILFNDLWAQQSPAQRAWLSRLADSPAAVERPDRALKELIQRRFVEARDDAMHVAVPMFAAWIREREPAPDDPADARLA